MTCVIPDSIRDPVYSTASCYTPPMSEQDLISRFFDRPNDAPNVSIGIGDDAALLSLPPDTELATSIDTLTKGVNFPDNTSAEDIGYKAIAVSLSDMAAMGAQPSTTLLSLTIPSSDEAWLQAFSIGLFELINEYDMQLIGGDITRGPLSVTTVVNGFIPKGQALRRSSAKTGDLIYVTGTLGDAGVALTENSDTACLKKLNRPTPRIQTGIALRTIASAAIDISDGLVIDLERICRASKVGAQLNIDHVPCHKAPIELALTAGDDFELCFTVPAEKEAMLNTLNLDIPIQKIGIIRETKTIDLIRDDGTHMTLKKKGYDHF